MAHHLLGAGGVARNTSAVKQKPDQLNVWKGFISNEAIQYPSFAQLLMIMIATPCNTSDLERGYTFLEMVALKRKNALKPENLEILFLLAALKIPVKLADDHYKEVDYLGNESRNYILTYIFIRKTVIKSILACFIAF